MLLVLIARLVLAVVFAVAGVTKLVDRKGTRQAVTAFGAPKSSAGVLAVALPLAELAVAGLLLPATTALLGALGALLLLGVFTAAVAASLARGEAPECHCFGQLHSAPASSKTLARNTGLIGLAAFALAGTLAAPSTSATAWIADLDGTGIVALAVVAAAALLVSAGAVGFTSLLRSYGQVLTRLERVEAVLVEAGIELEDDAKAELGLEPGTPAPTFTLESVDGETVTLDALTAAGVPALLVFTSPHCGPCAQLLPTAAAWQREHSGELVIAFLSDGSPQEVLAEAAEFELENVLVDVDRRVYEAYQAAGTPGAALVAADGRVASWLASGARAIERLVADVLAQGTDDEHGLEVGTDAPALELADLDGGRVSLAELRGRESLLLFWNPECGFCRGMHGGLLEWERKSNGVTPQLVVVSSGDAESTRAEGFRSRVLLDEAFAAGEAFHAAGTPMAVLLDAEGKIASRVAAGAEAVLALAHSPSRP